MGLSPSVVQLFKNFAAFYGTLRFITMFTKALPTGPYPDPGQNYLWAKISTEDLPNTWEV
jgi:hypothetical protein